MSDARPYLTIHKIGNPTLSHATHHGKISFFSAKFIMNYEPKEHCNFENVFPLLNNLYSVLVRQ